MIRTSTRHATRAAVLSAAVLLLGCTTSDWRYSRQRPNETVTTRVTVTSTPTGAEVYLNGDDMGETPFVVPIRYSCEVRVYERRKALPYLHVESKELRSWIRNDFRFRFRKTGHRDVVREVTLTGEETAEVQATLPPE